MKSTTLIDFHQQLNARIVPFAGFNMPLEYTGVNEEHIHVRTQAGVFDVSHMGEIWIKGDKAFELTQKLTCNDISKIQPGKIHYSCLTNSQGGIIDDLLVYHYERDKYLLVVNAANTDKDWQWIKQQNTIGAEIENASEKISQLAIQGPKAQEVLQALTEINLAEISRFHFVTGAIAGADEVIISHTGYTGAGGFELYFYNKDAKIIWENLFEAGKEIVKPIGLAARDTLRLEAGLCLHGNDIDETTSPLEAGLGWTVKFTENNDFIGRDVLRKQKAEGLKRRLRGFVLQKRGIPRKSYDIVNKKGKNIGKVTSGTMSPMLKQGIGMGYIAIEEAGIDNEIFIQIRNKQVKAKIVKLPFVK